MSGTNRREIDRRAFLHGAAALPLLSVAGQCLWARPDDKQGAFPGMIVRQSQPHNLEFPFSSLDSFLTPNDRFYVRNHFALPEIDAKTWRLKLEGVVERPQEFTLDQLRQLPSKTQVATLECAGNSRVFLVPRAKGVNWELGAVSTAEWTGVPLAALLQSAGVRKDAVEVILEGADAGEVNEDPKSPGRIHFARSMPIKKAQAPEVLLAYKMNGADLPPAHGYPLRVVVPGWYGMASVKWLTRIVIAPVTFRGYFQTMDYAYFRKVAGLPSLVALGQIDVKAEIARPARFEAIPANATYRVHGAAWTGESDVTKVEVSTDGGASWNEARLLDKPVRVAWRMWEYDWKTPAQPGRRVLMARAADAAGHTQPLTHDPDRRHYMINHVLPMEVEVK